MVVCGEPQFADNVFDTVTNPSVIVEVLSPSTEAYDRGAKFESYRTLESLQDYILIAQDRIHIEHYARQTGGTWSFQEISDREGALSIPSLQCEIPVSGIYENVTFDAPPAAS
jgi:Uma2 family endonuclease